MPIISRTLTKIANREDIAPGWKKWRVDGIDSRGNRWSHGPFGGLAADAEIVRTTCWPQEILENQEEQEVRRKIEDAPAFDISSYVPDDMTLNEFRRRLAKRFWRGNFNEDRKFMAKVAPYIASFTAAQIAGVLGISQAKAQLGIDKAVNIRDNLLAQMEAVDALAEVIE